MGSWSLMERMVPSSAWVNIFLVGPREKGQEALLLCSCQVFSTLNNQDAGKFDLQLRDPRGRALPVTKHLCRARISPAAGPGCVWVPASC